MQKNAEAMKNAEQKEQNATLVGMLYGEDIKASRPAFQPQVAITRVWRQGRKVFTTYDIMCGVRTGNGLGEYYFLNDYFNPDSTKPTSVRGEKRVGKELEQAQRIYDCSIIYTGCNIRCMEDI